MTPPPSHQIVALDGPGGETLISRPVAFVVPPDRQAELQAHFDELWQHVATLQDHRLLALVGSLVVENALDGLLRAVMPRFSQMDESKDFSFGMRIRVAKALDLIPRRLISSLDAIRHIRNDFAHDLSLQTFEGLPAGRIAAVRERLEEYGEHYVTDAPSDSQALERLVNFTALGLLVYRMHLVVFNDAVRHAGFGDCMRSFVQAGQPQKP